MELSCIWEHNGGDTLLHCANFPGAYTRGHSLEAAIDKLPEEIRCYCAWAGFTAPEALTSAITFEKPSSLEIRDADSDVIFPQERQPMTLEEYRQQKALVLKSAEDFHALYRSVPDPCASVLPRRRTFYGSLPVTGEEMYIHTKSVNAYYFAELDVEADNDGSILDCRSRGFAQLEQMPDFLTRGVILGSYDEEWSLRKLLRRFLWHDRIHAKAMYRMALAAFGPEGAENVFSFSETLL